MGAGGLLVRGCGGFLGGAEVVLGFAGGFAELALGRGVDGGVGELGCLLGVRRGPGGSRRRRSRGYGPVRAVLERAGCAGTAPGRARPLWSGGS